MNPDRAIIHAEDIAFHRRCGLPLPADGKLKRGVLYQQEGKYYRLRRGRVVEIPAAWVGQTLHPQTKRKRPSKAIHKRRKMLKYGDHPKKGRRT